MLHPYRMESYLIPPVSTTGLITTESDMWGFEPVQQEQFVLLMTYCESTSI